jgi:hypothetical protein
MGRASVDLRPSVIHRKVISGFRAVVGPSPLQAVATPPDLYVGS